MHQSRQDALLLVEDDDELRIALAELLKLEGYRVREAWNGAHALRILKPDGESPPFAILLGLTMPTLDGWEFRRALAGIPDYADVPVVVMSAVDEEDEEIVSKARLPGVKYSHKPIELETLLLILTGLHPHHAPEFVRGRHLRVAPAPRSRG